jgi:hypothetical protein
VETASPLRVVPQSCIVSKKCLMSSRITLPPGAFPIVTIQIIAPPTATFYPHTVCYSYYLTDRPHLTRYYIIVEQTERLEGSSERPFLQVASKQLEAIQSQIDSPVLEAKTESKKFFSDSNEMPRRHQPLSVQSAPPAFHRPRQEMSTGHSSQSHRARTSRCVASTKKKSKQRRTENSIKENDRLRTENFFGFLYLLAFCSLLFFLIFLFLLCLLFLFYLYAFHSRYK